MSKFQLKIIKCAKNKEYTNTGKTKINRSCPWEDLDIGFTSKRLSFYLFIFLASLDLRCFVYIFLSCSKWELLSICGTWASYRPSFSCCRVQALELMSSRASGVVAHRLSCPATCGILVPGSGIEPVSPALAGRFLTIGPPGKSQYTDFWFRLFGLFLHYFLSCTIKFKWLLREFYVICWHPAWYLICSCVPGRQNSRSMQRPN